MNKIEAHLDNDGIMHVEYPLHTGVTFDNVLKEFEDRLEITKEITPLLVKIHGKSAFDAEARRFLCSPQHSAITSAAAIFSDSSSGHQEYSSMLLNYLKVLISHHSSARFLKVKRTHSIG